MRLTLAVLALSLAAQSHARETLPHPCTIPAHLAASLPKSAEHRRARLENERSALSNQIAAFEGQCSRPIVAGSGEHRTCLALDRAVNANVQGYLDALTANQAALRLEIDHERTGFETRVATLDRRIADARAKLVADGASISGIEAAAKEWEDLSEQARLKARTTARDVVIDTVLDYLTDIRTPQIALDEKSLAAFQRVIGDITLPVGKKLSKADLDLLFEWDRHFIVLGPRIALRLEENRDYVRFLGSAKAFNDVLNWVDAKNGFDSPEQSDEFRRRYVNLLKPFIRDPGLKLLVNQWDLNISLAFLLITEHEAEQRVDQLSKLGAERLKGIASLSRYHNALVDERSALKRLRARTPVTFASGCPI